MTKILIYLVILTIISSVFSLEIIELNHDVSVNSIPDPIPDVEPFKLEAVQTGYRPIQDGNITRMFWVATNRITTVEHIGTHIDAPFNFFEHGWTVDQIPLERLFGPVSVIDISEKAARNRSYELSIEDVDFWIKENGIFPNNSAIFVNAGWSKKYSDKADYAGHATDLFQYKFPGISLKTVQYIFKLAEQHGIDILAFGVDFLSVHSIPVERYKLHYEICKRNVYIIENLNDLEKLPTVGARMMVMPMKLKGGTGSPARVLARLPYE